MTFQQAVKHCLTNNYANFNGTAARSEFWWFYLFTLIVSWVALGLGSLISGGWGNTLQGIVHLVLLLPMLAVGARRLHDVGRSGWWQLLIPTLIGILVLIYWWVQPGKSGSASPTAQGDA